MRKNLLMASFLFMGIYGSAQTVIFEDNFNDPAKVALWENTDRDGDGENGNFIMQKKMICPLSQVILQHPGLGF